MTPRRVIIVLGLVGAAVVVSALLSRGGKDTSSGELIVFHAGSLSVPFRELSALFEERHPGVRVRAEAAGSRACARKITDLGHRCDVLGSADYKVVENLLMPDFAGFNIHFATNEIGIAYTDRSRMSNEIGPDNWHEMLLRPEVTFGRSDSDSDPCGYRTAMMFQLAEKHYGVPGLAARLQAKHGARFMRPKETDLLALLEIGEVDYVFIYRSVAGQHGLKFLRLPDEVNLASADLAHVYKTAQVMVTGKKPGEFIARVGAPIVYSVTIPRNAPNAETAEAYVALLLSAEGQRIMQSNGQVPIAPAHAGERDTVPERLRPFLDQ